MLIAPISTQIPANREFYREFCGFGSLRADFGAKNLCAAGTSRTIPYAINREIISYEQGISKSQQGIEAINALELVLSAQTCSLSGLSAVARAGRQSITLNWKCLRDLPGRPPGESDVSAKGAICAQWYQDLQ